MRTHIVKLNQLDHKWFLVDADGKALGRLATEIAHVLRGKHKPTFSPHLDNGDFVIVVNATKVSVAPGNLTGKVYLRYSGYPGGLKSITLGKMFSTKPIEVIRHAVRGMLPQNALGRKQLRKLKIYSGPDHPHQSQQPQPFIFRLNRRSN